jgi:glycosyltransferase involved in cell wall biosynthesis
MMTSAAYELKVLFVSTWRPKPCGIATFSHDLSRALLAAEPLTDYRVVAINDPGDAFTYPPVVRQQLDREELGSLKRIARYINASGADIVSLQHEFGIWGGFDGEFILPFLDRLRVPVVATLHAVPLAESTFNQRNRLRLLRAIGQRVAHSVVFLPEARDYLVNALDLPPERITVIPHGAPAFDRAQRPAARARLAITDRLVLTTFGLLSRFKGLEDAIRALPPLVADFPNLLYLVLGQPHPYEPAEFYPGLQQLVRDLGLADHVRFVGHFLSDDELADALVATDIYLTPYHDLTQVSSGTLTFALSAGCCCVSTPYLYARHALADGRGVLAPPHDPAALAAALWPLLADPAQRAAYASAAAAYGATLHWPRIGRHYLDLFGAVARGEPPTTRKGDESWPD